MNIVLNDCKREMKWMKEDSVDSIVCDPPYELGFMGKKWDASGIAYDVEVWQEALRVLKPGGHLLAFGGTRTHHRLMVAIEDAGFEIRDCLMWMYGTGFPKSHNISKAIDKTGGKNLSWFINYILDIAKERGIKKSELTMLFPSKNGKPTGWLYNKKHTQGITLEQYNTLKEFLNLPFETLEEAEREIIGKKTAGIGSGKTYAFTDSNADAVKVIDITMGATLEAKKWDGWGTALKPAYEPIVLARKPLSEKTIANNVLTHGTGGINIDDCRIETEDLLSIGSNNRKDAIINFGMKDNKEVQGQHKLGRFPANVILDEVAGQILDGQSGHMKSVKSKRGVGFNNSKVYGTGDLSFDTERGFNDKGGASRFFYCPKASKKERNEGVEVNTHPTVKPIKLMEYLVKLITPPNGTVLDPFMGSGSTGCACINLGFDFYGIELEESSYEIAKARIGYHQKLTP